MTINFSTPADGEKSISVFETTIGYLGGLLAAYDLSGDERLLEKSIELGDLLYCAFDTPNRMPITHFEWRLARSERVKQDADSQALLADVGSLSLAIHTAVAAHRRSEVVRCHSQDLRYP